MKKIGVELLLIGLPLLMALFLLWGGISLWQDTQASINWPSVDGRIIVSEVRARERKSRKDLDYPFISYKFTVDNVEYESNKFNIENKYIMKNNEIEKRLNKYPKGKQVRVYYDPKNPLNAVLEPGGDPLRAAYNNLLWGTISLILAIIVIAGFALELRTSDDKAAIETNPP